MSSTYYDLRHIRDGLQSYIEQMGYEAVLFESGDIPFKHDVPLDESCYAEIHGCHILVLIVGSRYGSAVSSEKEKVQNTDANKRYEFYNSITRKEYLTARGRDIPIFIFVDKNVWAEYDTYKRNRDNTAVVYAHVDNVNVFRLLDDIAAQSTNNFVRGFERLDDITTWLRDQWAGLFAEALTRRASEPTIRDLASQISDLGQVGNTLREYTESIVRFLKPGAESNQLITDQKHRLRSIRLRRFAKEPMIKYLVNNKDVEVRYGASITVDQAYDAMASSSTATDYLKKLGLDDDAVERFEAEHGSLVQRDFRELQ
ncbi:MAG: DUF4062 domain-containing protein [Tepidisphaeraceae bacterium]